METRVALWWCGIIWSGEEGGSRGDGGHGANDGSLLGMLGRALLVFFLLLLLVSLLQKRNRMNQ
jgi:hypothetical protein